MHKLRVIALWLPTIVALFAGVNANFEACPFALMQAAYHGLPEISSPVAVAHSTSGYSNPLQTNNVQYTPAQTFSSLLQGFLGNNGGGDLYHPSLLEPLHSENIIYKSFFNEVKPKDSPKCATPPDSCANDTAHYYYRSIDGSCNNLQYPGYGIARSRYGRLLPPNYSENSSPTLSKNGAPLPGARLLSLTLFGDELTQDEFRTLTTMQFGQIVAHDLSRLSTAGAPDDCCSNVGNQKCYPILLHPSGPISLGSEKKCLGFSRALTDLEANCNQNSPYNEKISVVTAYFDMSYIYGNSLEQNEKVRQYTGGLLKTSFVNNRQWLPISLNEDGDCGEDNYKCYSIPDRRNQFIPSITVIQTILVREHNRIACTLSQLNPHYSDEKLFQEARKINIAQYQHIIYYEWLPIMLGASYAYANRLIYNVHGGEYVNDYDDNVDPAPYVESAAAAFRYPHTQVPGYFSLVTPSRIVNETKRLSDYFEKPSNIDFLVDGDNFDSVIRGMTSQPQKRSDTNIDKEIKHYFNRKPTEEYGSDLKSIDIQRGRDYGLPSYNDLRQYCGLPRAYDWSDFVSEIPVEKIELLQRLYASPEDVDLNVGGALEIHSPESLLGPTFQCIMGKQFLTARISDRFFFENENLFSGFSREQLAEIRKASMSGLFCNNGDYLQFIQPNAFIVPNPNNILINCNLIPQIDLSKWKEVQQQPFY